METSQANIGIGDSSLMSPVFKQGLLLDPESEPHVYGVILSCIYRQMLYIHM